MGTALVLALGIVSAGMCLGILIGKFTARQKSDQRIQEAFLRGKEEADVEKANLGVALNEELLKLRQGIEGVAQAYESTVRLVQDRLGNSIKTSTLELEGPDERQLSLDFDRKPSVEIPPTEGILAQSETPTEQTPELALKPERVELETIQAESLEDLPPHHDDASNGRDKAFSLQ